MESYQRAHGRIDLKEMSYKVDNQHWSGLIECTSFWLTLYNYCMQQSLYPFVFQEGAT